MGAVVSRWKAKPSTVEVLEGIDKELQTLEEYGEQYQKQLKRWVWRLLLYSSLLYLLTCTVVYFWYLPEQTIGRVIVLLPFLAFPILVWLLRKLLMFLFSRRTEKNNEKLEDLKSQKRKILEQVMETETYKNAKLILERFDPDSKKAEVESTPMRSLVTPRPGQELRQRNVLQRTPVVVNPVNPALARPPLPPTTTPTGQLLHSAPGGPPERMSALAAQQSLMRRPVTPGSPLPAGLHPPGPPLARPILPRQRGAVDRVIEYLVGDGPQNRFALICQHCLSHNGMALKEEFEYIAFRCAYCYVLNPARRSRPLSPRPPEGCAEIRGPDSPIPAAPAPEPRDSPSAAAETQLVASPAHEAERGLEPASALASPLNEDPAGTKEPASPPSLQIALETSDGELDVSAMEVE